MGFALVLVAAGSQPYKLSLLQIAGGIGAVALMFLFLVPYSQYGRNAVAKDLSLGDRIASISDLLSIPRSVPAGGPSREVDH